MVKVRQDPRRTYNVAVDNNMLIDSKRNCSTSLKVAISSFLNRLHPIFLQLSLNPLPEPPACNAFRYFLVFPKNSSTGFLVESTSCFNPLMAL